jgi:hypothetical protein
LVTATVAVQPPGGAGVVVVVVAVVVGVVVGPVRAVV